MKTKNVKRFPIKITEISEHTGREIEGKDDIFFFPGNLMMFLERSTP